MASQTLYTGSDPMLPLAFLPPPWQVFLNDLHDKHHTGKYRDILFSVSTIKEMTLEQAVSCTQTHIKLLLGSQELEGGRAVSIWAQFAELPGPHVSYHCVDTGKGGINGAFIGVEEVLRKPEILFLPFWLIRPQQVKKTPRKRRLLSMQWCYTFSIWPAGCATNSPKNSNILSSPQK